MGHSDVGSADGPLPGVMLIQAWEVNGQGRAGPGGKFCCALQHAGS